MNNLNIVTVVQARTGSTRLPKKVMMSICGEPLLLRMIERVRSANLAGTVVVATSTNKDDDVIEELCSAHNIDIFRGHPDDLLDRHYKTGLKYKADAIVKIPSDCPLIDPRIIDRIIKYFIDNRDKYDFASNLHPATYPDGNDVEIMKFSVLEDAWKFATKQFEREHTTPYIWENTDKFNIGNVRWSTGLDFSSTHRWTIDYEEDYVFIRSIYEELYPGRKMFSIYDILNLLADKPFLSEINKKYTGQYWYDNHLDELSNIEEYKRKKAE